MLHAPDDGSAPLTLRAADLKQYLYCPRILYYTYVLPIRHRVTHKMQEGTEAHLDLDRLEKRRKLVEYGLDRGTREFHVRLYSQRLGLEGVLDLLVRSPKGLYPVEFKHTTRDAALHHKYQLAAYALLLEDTFHEPVRAGFLYLIPGRRIRLVEITPNVRLHLHRTLSAMRRLVMREAMPDVPRSRARCWDCEYRTFCGDLDFRGGRERVLLIGGRETAPSERAAAESP